MRKQILFCQQCRKYTMKETCNTCDNTTIKKTPPKFSFQDIGRKYRVKELKGKLQEK